MNQQMLDDSGKNFLLSLFKASNADESAKVSMYEIGELLGLDRAQTDFIVSELSASNYVNIKTLSGGIGITADGIDAARKLGAKDEKTQNHQRLGSDPVLDNAAASTCDLMASSIKSEASSLRLDFDAMAELMADLKTIDAQLNSPKPKTAVIRETFISVLAVLEKAENKKILQQIQNYLD